MRAAHGAQPQGRLTCELRRRESFSASHRLHSPMLSDEDNRKVFGKCNWANGHGHNYVLDVTVRGDVDPVTGMVMNLADLKRLIADHVLAVVDHRNLDKDVEFFAASQTPSTTENVAAFVWQALRPHLPPRLDLEVCIGETDKNWVVFRGPHASRL